MFVINYDIKDTETIDKFINRAKELGEIETFLSNAIFLDCNKNTNEVYNKLRECIADSDLFFITPFNKQDMNGWLNKTSVDWLINKNF